jgi:hypothetical protein
MKYDDASWHYGGDFPADLPHEAAATHSGMFLAWALLSGLAGEIHTEEMPEGIAALRERATTPGRFFLQFCDGKLTDEDLDEEGNAFASAYLDFATGKYLADYAESVLGDLPSLYHAPDSWNTYEAIEAVLNRRLAAWRNGG